MRWFRLHSSTRWTTRVLRVGTNVNPIRLGTISLHEGHIPAVIRYSAGSDPDDSRDNFVALDSGITVWTHQDEHLLADSYPPGTSHRQRRWTRSRGARLALTESAEQHKPLIFEIAEPLPDALLVKTQKRKAPDPVRNSAHQGLVRGDRLGAKAHLASDPSVQPLGELDLAGTRVRPSPLPDAGLLLVEKPVGLVLGSEPLLS